MAVANRHYWDEATGGYFFAADDTEALILRPKTALDNPNPAGNGVMAGVLARLFHLTGDPAYRDRAEAVIAAFAGDVERQMFGFADAHQCRRAAAARLADRHPRETR